MSFMRNLGQGTSRSKGPWERRLLLWIVGAVVFAVIVITAAFYFDQFTEGDVFCGQLCHPNRPELAAHEISPHAHVECGICHVGPGLWPKVEAKIFGVGELVSLITNSYHRPIELPVERMRPVEDTCLQCHWPDLLDEDLVQRVPVVAPDEENSLTRTDLTVRIDPGQADNGAHWHVENPVEYISLDPLGQDVAWASYTRDGRPVTYQAEGINLTAEQLERLPRRQLDCLDCHNRATHIFYNPEALLDEALARGEIDSSLPFVKREGHRLLTESYPTQDAGIEAMDKLRDFYSSEYPDVASGQSVAVDHAVDVLKEIYHRTTFPEMNLNWKSYPNNLGHMAFPGCFRCHDGEHVSEQGDPISQNCTLCHSVPVTTVPGQKPDEASAISAAGQVYDKPDSHRDTNFVWDHRLLAGDACAECHGPIEYGTDNSSFCANGACHAQEWPETALAARFVHPVELVGQHAQAACGDCHQSAREPDLDECADCHQPSREPHYGSECATCHTPRGWEESANSWLAGMPSAPHRVEAGLDCLGCHGDAGPKPVPVSHVGMTAQVCADCHDGLPATALVSIPHAVGEADSCQSCHGEGALKPGSDIHQEIPADSCFACHEGAPVGEMPAIPHVVEGRGRCLDCHAAGKLAPVPPSHEGRTNESCLLCHQS